MSPRPKHRWELLGGGGGWEVWKCSICERKAIPSIFGFIWPFPRCQRLITASDVNAALVAKANELWGGKP